MKTKREGNYPQCVCVYPAASENPDTFSRLSFLFFSYFFGRVSTCAAGFPLAQPETLFIIHWVVEPKLQRLFDCHSH